LNYDYFAITALLSRAEFGFGAEQSVGETTSDESRDLDVRVVDRISRARRSTSRSRTSQLIVLNSLVQRWRISQC